MVYGGAQCTLYTVHDMYIVLAWYMAVYLVHGTQYSIQYTRAGTTSGRSTAPRLAGGGADLPARMPGGVN